MKRIEAREYRKIEQLNAGLQEFEALGYSLHSWNMIRPASAHTYDATYAAIFVKLPAAAKPDGIRAR